MSKPPIAGVTPAAETITLYFKEGSSDKVYTANLEKSGAGWMVTFAYGRRGSTMTTGSKTAAPADYQVAKKIYDKLVREKTAKGYTPGEDGSAYTRTVLEARDTGVRCQLLNEMQESELERLIQDDAWGAQEKIDGRRQLIKKIGEDVVGINRKGLVVSIAHAVVKSALAISGDQLTIDGESVGDLVYVFDILQLNADLRAQPYLQRYRILEGTKLGPGMRLVPLAIGPAAKRNLLAHLRASNAEGIVFKRLDALYTPGRPDSGGNALKFKFYATGSFFVSHHNQKRSVALEVLVDGKRTPIGSVTIPPNKAVPPGGSIVEIRYLYCFKGGSLYQPTYLSVRDDLDINDCSSLQLKFKPEGAEDDEA